MRLTTGKRFSRVAMAMVALGAGAFLAGCASAPAPKVASEKKRPKEYFAESEYGVKASPRVSNLRTRLPRGGGREQIGKPYKVKGQWYHPKEEPGYTRVGAASWYGDAFHGRLTANGEIYDMTHLTAAHPTMPLPSYARVTNLKNGNSVIVRVNDRGPFAHGRVIDLSKRAAEMLDYTHAGVAKVKVEYVGRAPLHGQDDQFLLASYRPGGSGPSPSDGLPTGVMVAMAGPTPSATVAAASAAFPGVLTDRQAAPAAGELALPAFGPLVPERPDGLPSIEVAASGEMTLSYADARIAGAASAFAAMDASLSMTPEDVVHSWKRSQPSSAPFVAVGTYDSRAKAEAIAARLSGLGTLRIEADETGRAPAYAVVLHADGTRLDAALRAAWQNGAADAMVVRD